MNKIIIVGIIAALSMTSGKHSTNERSELDEARKAIAASNDIYFESFVKNDPGIFIDRYAEDACIMAPNAPASCGPDAPLKFFRLAYDEIGLRNGKFITKHCCVYT